MSKYLTLHGCFNILNKPNVTAITCFKQKEKVFPFKFRDDRTYLCL